MSNADSFMTSISPCPIYITCPSNVQLQTVVLLSSPWAGSLFKVYCREVVWQVRSMCYQICSHVLLRKTGHRRRIIMTNREVQTERGWYDGIDGKCEVRQMTFVKSWWTKQGNQGNGGEVTIDTVRWGEYSYNVQQCYISKGVLWSDTATAKIVPKIQMRKRKSERRAGFRSVKVSVRVQRRGRYNFNARHSG